MASHSDRVLNATQRFFQKNQRVVSSKRKKRGKSEHLTEEQEQSALVIAMRKAKLTFQHCPMGIAARSAVSGARMRKMGSHKGYPDLIVHDRPPRFPNAPGVVIELKRAKPARSRVSDEQKVWLAKLSSFGWLCKICYGATEAAQFLRECGYQIGEPHGLRKDSNGSNVQRQSGLFKPDDSTASHDDSRDTA